MVDASDSGIGGVVNQLVNKHWQPLAFFSQKLDSTQKKYSTYDRELLSMYSSVKHFRNILEGQVFTIFTDQKPLIYAFQQSNDKATPRQFRYLDYISQFSTDIRHISGKDNVVADTLSRIDSLTLTGSIDYKLFAIDQESDEELQTLRNNPTKTKLNSFAWNITTS